ncbi:MAG: NADPH:quinone reductase [Alphaproteobacteria bacterium]|nr:NADPH:quinone reductase [Alphaproteobacteria bacterium]
MRAAWYTRTGTAAEVLELGDLPPETLGPLSPGEVKIQLCASGINPADVKRRAGWGGSNMQHDLVIPHADGAGVVEAVGEGVPDSLVGQRVWLHNAQGGYGEAGRAFGTAAETIQLPASQVFALPDQLDFADGACLGIPALTAFHAVFADGPVSGKTILVTGAAGAVGHFAAQFARDAGAHVIATVSTEEKAAHVADIGVHDIIFRHNEDVAERVLTLTGGEGADRIVEVDFGANLDVIQKILKPGAVIAAYSSTAVPEPTLPYYAFAFRGATLRFIQGFLLSPEVIGAATELIGKMAARDALKVAIAARLPLNKIVEAHEMVESGNAIGNVVLDVSEHH